MTPDREFEIKGYIIIKNIVPVKKWHKIAKNLEHFGRLDDQQTPNSPSLYKRKELIPLHNLLLKKLEKLTNLKLYKTYQYFRIYKKGAILKPHTDRPSCEISMTLNLGGDDWKIGIFDNNNTPRQYTLKPGDALIYHGMDLIHWRPGKFKGKELIQIFLHYVDAEGPYRAHKNDCLTQ